MLAANHALLRDASRQIAINSILATGDDRIGEEIEKLAPNHNAVLLSNHGPVVGGKTLRQAFFNAEELEDTARLYITLRQQGFTTLTEEQVNELESRYPKK